MAEKTLPTDPPAGQKKPSLLAQAAKALSQLGLTFFVLLLVLALFATAGRDPRIAILMAICAVVPLVFGPGRYRLIGVVALLVAGGFYASSQPPPKRPVALAPLPGAAGAARIHFVVVESIARDPDPARRPWRREIAQRKRHPG